MTTDYIIDYEEVASQMQTPEFNELWELAYEQYMNDGSYYEGASQSTHNEEYVVLRFARIFGRGFQGLLDWATPTIDPFPPMDEEIPF